MNSCLYECQVMHARLEPRAHRFVYRLFLFAFDLDELDGLDARLRLFSRGRRNLFSFRDGDYLPVTEASSGVASQPGRPGGVPLKQRVVDFVAQHGIELRGGRVVLVTLPRVAGYLFNPVSFYFCFDRHGEPAAAVAEVTNTFKEVKPYLIGSLTKSGNVFSARIPKDFYVSPFSDVDLAFDFRLTLPDQRLRVRIDDYEGGRRTLMSALSGVQVPLTDRRLAWFSLKYPLMTLQVITLIHWQALRLWMKRVPWFAKAARPEAQRGLYRPHRSLAKDGLRRPEPALAPLSKT